MVTFLVVGADSRVLFYLLAAAAFGGALLFIVLVGLGRGL